MTEELWETVSDFHFQHHLLCLLTFLSLSPVILVAGGRSTAFQYQSSLTGVDRMRTGFKGEGLNVLEKMIRRAGPDSQILAVMLMDATHNLSEVQEQL